MLTDYRVAGWEGMLKIQGQASRPFFFFSEPGNSLGAGVRAREPRGWAKRRTGRTGRLRQGATVGAGCDADPRRLRSYQGLQSVAASGLGFSIKKNLQNIQNINSDINSELFASSNIGMLDSVDAGRTAMWNHQSCFLSSALFPVRDGAVGF